MAITIKSLQVEYTEEDAFVARGQILDEEPLPLGELEEADFKAASAQAFKGGRLLVNLRRKEG